MPIVPVALGDRSYDIHIAAGALDHVGELIKPKLAGAKVLVVADATVAELHGARLLASLAAAGLQGTIATFAPGEPSKTLATAEAMWQACAAAKIDRTDAILGFGGGVSGDLAGFVAACWMRGVRFVQVPTTLLAMVDSSVGGKTGVNSSAGKNLVGAFKQPVAVVIDPTLVQTMDRREYRAGLAEVLKYGIIRDAEFFAWQERNASDLERGGAASVEYAVAESCRIKAWYVAEDETEQGVRAQLNYGHTFGHAIERETRYERYLHGEAVGLGMRMAAVLAWRIGALSDDSLLKRQDELLKLYRLPLVHITRDLEASSRSLTAACGLDKKVARGRTRFILPTAIGTADLIEAPDEEQVRKAFLAGMTQG
jgi:3-dehydroquinate synthase